MLFTDDRRGLLRGIPENVAWRKGQETTVTSRNQETRTSKGKERSLNTHVSSFRSPLYIQRSPGLLGYKQYFNNYCLRLNSAIMNHWLGQLSVSIIWFPLNVIVSDPFFFLQGFLNLTPKFWELWLVRQVWRLDM